MVGMANVKREIKRRWRKAIGPYNYRVVKKNNGGIPVGPPMKMVCPTSYVCCHGNGSGEIFYDISKIFHLCRCRLTSERIENNLMASGFKVSKIMIKGRITVIYFQPYA